MKFNRSLVIILFLLSASSSFGQNKNMGIEVFGGTHNFKSDYFNTGFNVQCNFRKIFSVNSGLSYEKMIERTESFSEFTPEGFYEFKYYQTTWTIPYMYVPLNFRATFGRKVNVFLEIGGAYSRFQTTIADVKFDYLFPDPDKPKEATYRFEHGDERRFMITSGAGISVPVSDHFTLRFTAKRSWYRYGVSFSEDVFYNYFRKTPGFVKMKFNLGLVYQFNFSKESKYAFTTYYPKFEKN